MTETTLKEMFGRILDTEAPPTRPVDEVLAHNGRILRRRRLGGVLAAGVLAMAAAGGGGVAILQSGSSPRSEVAANGPALRPGTPTPTPPTPSGSVAPTDGGVKRRSTEVLQVLLAAVPTGYQISKDSEVVGRDGTTYPLRAVYTRQPADRADGSDPDRWRYSATVEMRYGKQAAVLTLEIMPRDPEYRIVPDEPCFSQVPWEDERCSASRAGDGTRVRLSWVDGPDGRTYYATAIYDTVFVRAGQGPRSRAGLAANPRRVVDDRALADIATDPRLRE